MDGLNILIIAFLGASLLLLLNMAKQRQEFKKLLIIEKKRIDAKKEERETKVFKMNLSYFKALKTQIDFFFMFRKNKEMANYLYYGILIAEAGIFIVFLFWNKLVFALAFPLMLHFSMIKSMELLGLSLHHYIQKELPVAIKHLIKVMSKTSDLKSIMFETSKNLEEPLRGMFFNMSRRMINENHEKVIMEVADEVDNIWFYAFAFLMVSYKEQSKKSDIIKNLTTLADMLDKEMYIKEKAITDKKFVVIMNYAIALIAVVLFVVNLLFNTHAYPFFFENLTGMLAVIFGIFAIIATLLINFTMSSRTD